jgi:hypothetical protein
MSHLIQFLITIVLTNHCRKSFRPFDHVDRAQEFSSISQSSVASHHLVNSIEFESDRV